MFGYNQEVSDLKSKVSGLEDKLEKCEKSHAEELEKLQRELNHTREDYEIAIQRKTESVDSYVQKETKELQKQIQELTIAKNNAEKEVAILTKAFENLGFDVKDMKDILNKLVDGIVSKNTVQLVK